MSPLLYFDPNNDDRNDHNSNRISQQRAVNTTLICNCRHCCGDVIQLFWNSWQPWNAQIPAFYWKDASCHQLKELISKPFTNILEIPLFPWNAAQLWFLLRILFTPLLLTSQSVLNHLCQKRLETGGVTWTTWLWMKRLLDCEITTELNLHLLRTALWSDIIELWVLTFTPGRV